MSLFEFHLWGMLVFTGLLLFITVSNLALLPRLDRRRGTSVKPPRVSILVPARNEERCIADCVRSLLAQEYPDFELLVLDDHSTDGTRAILDALAAENPRLGILDGEEPPPGWLGKHWACHQLAARAEGKLLLFTDADTVHHPRALSDAVELLQRRRAGLLSLMPRQVLGSFGERLLVPLMTWCIISFLPLALLRLLKKPFLAPANGQYMLFRREVYRRIDGHAAVRSHATDDVALGRRVVEAGDRLVFTDGARRVACRMYTGFAEAFAGFSKNFLAIFNYRTAFFIFAWVFIAVLFWEPVVIIVLELFGAAVDPTIHYIALAMLGVSLIQWLLVYLRFGYPVWAALGHPVVALLGTIVAFNSLRVTRRGRARWKGRTLIRWSGDNDDPADTPDDDPQGPERT